MATYSYSQLEGLWIQAGGPRAAAPIAAAIALAESGGNSNAYNSSGATGLWQILGDPFPGNAYDPMTNARMAVAKYRNNSQGTNNFSPWVTYTQGTYRQYLQGAVPPNIHTGLPPGQPFTGTTAGLGGLGSITGAFTSAATAVDWLLQPSHWIRILAFIVGAGSVLLGLAVLGLGVGS